MQVILDNLSAVIISGVLIFIFALVQIRGVQTSAESNVNYIVRTETLDLANMIERDIENMRTAAQVSDAQLNGVYSGGSYSCDMVVSSGQTTQFTFATLADPQNLGALSDPTLAPVTLVTYTLTDTGVTIPELVNGTTVNTTLWRLDRMISGASSGGSRGYVTDFRIEMFDAGTTGSIFATSTCPGNMAKIRFSLKLATDAVLEMAQDQRSTSQMNFSRYGTTIELTNWLD